MTGAGALRVDGELLSVKRVGGYTHLTVVAPGIPERFRPGNFVAVAVGGALSERCLRRGLPVHRVRPSGTYGGTVEVLMDADEPGRAWLAGLGAGSPVDVLGPLGRPFALPRQPVPCLLVGHGAAAAPLFPLADRLRERGCAVHMLLTGPDERSLFGVLEARRAAKTVQVATEDGSVGLRGVVSDVLPDLLSRTGVDVVYASGPLPVLHAVAAAAEMHGAWSQTAVPAPDGCGTGVCRGCALPVVGEDGLTRMVRACVEGPVFRGDRVRWGDIGTVPADAWGAEVAR